MKTSLQTGVVEQGFLGLINVTQELPPQLSQRRRLFEGHERIKAQLDTRKSFTLMVCLENDPNAKRYCDSLRTLFYNWKTSNPMNKGVYQMYQFRQGGRIGYAFKSLCKPLPTIDLKKIENWFSRDLIISGEFEALRYIFLHKDLKTAVDYCRVLQKDPSYSRSNIIGYIAGCANPAGPVAEFAEDLIEDVLQGIEK